MGGATGCVGRFSLVVCVLLVLVVTAPAASAQTDDACPYGWSTEETVWFAPPRIDTGIANPERADGCTLLDVIWRQEPFARHGQFVATVSRATLEFVDDGLLDPRDRARIVGAAARSSVGGPGDDAIPNTCDARLAIQFDDGPSSYRSQTLAVLREKQVTGNFMDVGQRVAANPQLVRFQVREGHLLLNHTMHHSNLNAVFAQAGAEGVIAEVLGAEETFAAVGAPISFRGMRTPFGSANAQVRQVLDSIGYVNFPDRIGTDDWLPERTPQEIADAIVAQLRPGAIISLHDGPYDTVAGAATVEALGLIIDAARERGYCFGKVDRHGGVVADRHVPTGASIPMVINPVPYHELLFGGGLPPEPFVIVEPWRPPEG